MRIFILILSLIFSVAFVVLNILGFNNILSLNEFYLINVIAEVLVSLLLGYFMYRTYVNHKKFKKLHQEITTRQASTVAQEQSKKKKHSPVFNKNANSTATSSPTQQASAAQNDPRRAPIREQATGTYSAQQSSASTTTQPTQSRSAAMDKTTPYNSPFGQ